jgi:hypothetical protein
MKFIRLIMLSLIWILTASPSFAESVSPAQTVWVNEAIVSTYTFNHKNFIERQRNIATYFTSDGWMAYSKALNESKLPEAVQKNNYFVSAVATNTPTIKTVGPSKWEATMPLLVVYKNPQYQQKQTLSVTISFQRAPSGQGVRGLAITQLNSTVIKPACKCPPNDTLPATISTGTDNTDSKDNKLEENQPQKQ